MGPTKRWAIAEAFSFGFFKTTTTRVDTYLRCIFLCSTVRLQKVGFYQRKDHKGGKLHLERTQRRQASFLWNRWTFILLFTSQLHRSIFTFYSVVDLDICSFFFLLHNIATNACGSCIFFSFFTHNNKKKVCILKQFWKDYSMQQKTS